MQELTNLSNLCYTAKTTFLAVRTSFDQLYLMLSAEFGTPEYENVQQWDLDMLGYYRAILGFANIYNQDEVELCQAQVELG